MNDTKVLLTLSEILDVLRRVDRKNLLTLKEVAEMLRINPLTLRDHLTRFPERVPPWILLPGSRQRRWRIEDVQAFIESGAAEGEKERLRKEEMKQEGLFPFPKGTRKIGRPTKRERLAKSLSGKKEGSG